MVLDCSLSSGMFGFLATESGVCPRYCMCTQFPVRSTFGRPLEKRHRVAAHGGSSCVRPVHSRSDFENRLYYRLLSPKYDRDFLPFGGSCRCAITGPLEIFFGQSICHRLRLVTRMHSVLPFCVKLHGRRIHDANIPSMIMVSVSVLG